MSIPQKQCPSCRHTTALDAAACTACGHQFRTQYAPPPLDQTQYVPPSPPPGHYGGHPPPGPPPPGYGPQYPPGQAPPHSGYQPPPPYQPGAPPGYPPGYPPGTAPGYPQGAPPGYPPLSTLPYTGKEKLPAGLLAIFLGPLGIHMFYLGMNGWGIGFLLLTLLTCGWGALITGTVSLVQGIMYLCANDYDFQVKYALEKRFF